jgi:hypothetical protein
MKRTTLHSAAVLPGVALALAILLPAPARAASDIVGKWHFVLDTPAGTREAAVTLERDGEKVTGTWGPAPIVKGTFIDGKLELAFPIETQEAGPGTLKITGTLDGDALAGKWAFNEYEGEFKATREK